MPSERIAKSEDFSAARAARRVDKGSGFTRTLARRQIIFEDWSSALSKDARADKGGRILFGPLAIGGASLTLRQGRGRRLIPPPSRALV